VLECWSVGVLECWSVGVLERCGLAVTERACRVTGAHQRTRLAHNDHNSNTPPLRCRPNLIETLLAPITLTVDREKRRATIRIPGIAESNVEPIKSPATGEEHRARIALPNGFEYKEAEMGNTVSCRVSAGDKLTFELKNTYAQLNAFDWSN
jgi:hypothetical protein